MDKNIIMVLIIIFFIIMASLQYTLNKILVSLNEIKDELKKTGDYRR